MAVEQQHGFPTDDEPTEAAHLRIELEEIRLDGHRGFPAEDEPTQAAALRIRLERIRVDARVKHRGSPAR